MENIEKKPPVIVIAGPTAAGKSELAIRLALEINGEIVSGDSMQIYRGMDIGTAKVSKEERALVPHHMIDLLDPTESCDVRFFKEHAVACIRDIQSRGKIPILCGGTGFYIRAILYDTPFDEEPADRSFREKLNEEAERYGNEFLYEKLQNVDPESCRKIHPNNRKRVIRALEYYHIFREPISRHNEETKELLSPFSFRYFVLTDDRDTLYRRIDRRVGEMAKDGLLEEVKRLVQSGVTRNMTSMQGIGYREFFPYFDGKKTLDETLDRIREDSRHYAKRQLTWFRRVPDAIWIDRSEAGSEDAMLSMIRNETKKLLGNERNETIKNRKEGNNHVGN